MTRTISWLWFWRTRRPPFMARPFILFSCEGRRWICFSRWWQYFFRLHFIVVEQYTNRLLKEGVYCQENSVFLRSVFDELCDRANEHVLSHRSTNNWVHEYGQIVQDAQPGLEIGDQMFTLVHFTYLNNNKSSNGRLFLSNQGIRCQPYGVY